jgi:hypothetical protein
MNMTDNHSQSFFGKSTGLLIQSSSKSEPYIFLTCIKKKPDDTWEKISQGEGKTIRCSLEEMVMILQILKQKILSWSGYHTYKENDTPISFNWENNKENKIWINIANYSKKLGMAQIELFKLLLKHLINEKIKNVSISNLPKIQINNIKTMEHLNKINSNDNTLNENKYIKHSNLKTNIQNNEKIEINGIIKAETDKALLLGFKSGQDLWFPKSIIYSNYESLIGRNQTFLTEKWILEKNGIKIGDL